MQEKSFIPSDTNRFKAMRRKAIGLSPEALVADELLATGQSLPLVMRPAVGGVNLVEWAGNNRAQVEEKLLAHGALLFRGFNVDSVERFGEVARALSSELLDYRERSSPRTQLRNGIYTSTDYPADQAIQFHNEQSYTHSWPMKLWFYCAQPAEQGGATPIADGREVYSLISREVRDRFNEKRVMYVRNYGDGVGLSWQEAFQTNDEAKVEEYCRSASIEFEWKGSRRRLRTRQIFDTITRHPRTGELVWFEHTAFFHITSLAPEIRRTLLEEFGEEDLPFNTYYGDGTPIEPFALEEIRAAYRTAAVRFDWQQHDILLIDNMLTSHAREPFVGQRKIVVAMAELFRPGKN
jgi:alpha-ketoglutarate-dependent taurine dioxygenase